jgi:CO dehydrogenase/acetyl-CoA synthase gamma subunit (corrinoid Fe-S protein)
LLSADLYLDKIDFRRYLSQTVCAECGLSSCKEFLDAVKSGTKNPHDCSFISRNQSYALEAISKIKELWPDVPVLTHPRPSFAGVMELNDPAPDSLVLISGNNEYTEQVIMTVLGTTICPFFVLFADTDGNTVDMAMIYQTLTAERICNSLRQAGLDKKSTSKVLMIPGLSASLKEGVESMTGWNVRVGPVCAAELPLFLSEICVPPGV